MALGRGDPLKMSGWEKVSEDYNNIFIFILSDYKKDERERR